MTVEHTLMQRSGSKCELCSSEQDLGLYEVPPQENSSNPDQCILACSSCRQQIQASLELDVNHWRCLNDSMWSPVPAVQVVAWRMLNRLSSESWAQDLLDMMYLEDEARQWAEVGLDTQIDDALANEEITPTLDCNGSVLQAGDTVTLIKDLPVKGAGFTAKRGTAVRNISLTSNPEHIEGRVNGTRIVLLTCYLKKSG